MDRTMNNWIYICFDVADESLALRILEIAKSMNVPARLSFCPKDDSELQQLLSCIDKSVCFVLLDSPASRGSRIVCTQTIHALSNSAKIILISTDGDLQMMALRTRRGMDMFLLAGSPGFEKDLADALMPFSSQSKSNNTDSLHQIQPRPIIGSSRYTSAPYGAPPGSYSPAAQAPPTAKKGIAGFLSFFSRRKNKSPVNPDKETGLLNSIENVSRQSSEGAKTERVHFSAIAPEEFRPGEYSMIDIVMYEDASRHIVDELKESSPTPTKETRSGALMAARGSSVTVILSSPDVEIEDSSQSQVWYGEHLRFTFAVKASPSCEKTAFLFNADVYINNVIATKLKFTMRRFFSNKHVTTVTRSDINSAYVSYASQDRTRVAAIVQGMQKARPEMDIFFDVESLRSGEDWEARLRHEIDDRDVLFLCWSGNAGKSEWVDFEWRYALSRKGVESIEPVPLEPPDSCPPPDELSSKHFNDKLLYVIYSNI